MRNYLPSLTLALTATAGLQASVIFSEDFETGQTIGDQPTGYTAIAPLTNDANNYVDIVNGANNFAGGGTGNGLAMYNNASASNGIEYNFVGSSAAQLSAFQVTLDFALTETDPDNTRFSLVLGAYNPSTSTVFNNSNNYFTEARLRANGQLGLLSNAGAESNFTFTAGVQERVKLTMIVNDFDSQSINYTNPLTGATESLSSNSVAYFVDGNGTHDLTYIAQLNLNRITPGGTIATTENNFGRLGIYSFSGSPLSYTFDNFEVSTVPEPGQYAAILGGVALLSIGLRRRFAKR